ncbi:hypothetical protein D9M71_168870 [compost metagenome]
MLADRQLHVFHRVGQRVGVQLALGEALHGGTGVAEQHAAGAVAVQQLAHQARRGFRVALGKGLEQAFAFFAEETLDGGFGLGAQAALVQQFLDGLGHGAVVGAFGAEGVQVVETVRVEQAQAREVAFQAQLFRGGGQQQHAGDDFGQLLHQAVFGAGLFRVPDQVVGFVDHQQVPAGGEGGILGAFAVLQPFKGNQGELGVLEGVAGIAFGEALGIVQGNLQIEAATHLHQPLVLEVFRNQDQHAVGAAGDELAVDDQAGFDGLAQAHFVGQQNARRNAVGHLAGDVQLMGDGLCAGAGETPEGRLQQARAVLQGVIAQGEPLVRVDLAGEQAIVGQAELDEVVQLGFREGAALILGSDAVIDEQAVDILDFLDVEFPAVEVGDLVAGGEAHAGQGSIAQRVLAGVASGRVEHGEQTAIRGQDGSEPKLCFAVTDPALPRLILLRHACLPEMKKPRMLTEPKAQGDAGYGPYIRKSVASAGKEAPKTADSLIKGGRHHAATHSAEPGPRLGPTGRGQAAPRHSASHAHAGERAGKRRGPGQAPSPGG